jgi:hypothetical protein
MHILQDNSTIQNVTDWTGLGGGGGREEEGTGRKAGRPDHHRETAEAEVGRYAEHDREHSGGAHGYRYTKCVERIGEHT